MTLTKEQSLSGILIQAAAYAVWLQGEFIRNGAELVTGLRNVYDLEENKALGDIHISAIEKGAKALLKSPSCRNKYAIIAARDIAYGFFDDLDIDGPTADMILQYGIFGKLIYG